MKPLILAAALLCWAQPAKAAETACSTRDDVLGQLASKYHEQTAASGLANNGGTIEILKSVVTDAQGQRTVGKTWTIIVSMPNGFSCLLAAGSDWQDAAPIDPNAGEPL